MPVCKIEGCSRKARARAMCGTHYQLWRKNGSPHIRRKLQGDLMPWLLANASNDQDACLAWPFGTNARGYGEITYEGRMQLASRVMCTLVHGDSPAPGMHAAHSCGRGEQRCVAPRHLRWATPAENAADKLLHGTATLGERNGAAKLSTATAIAIREAALRPGARQQRIAAEFGVTQQVVSDIKVGRTWSHATTSREVGP